MPDRGVVRQRKNAKKTKKGDSTTKAKPNQESTEPSISGGDDKASLSSIFFKHPLIWVGQLILIPYLSFLAIKYLSLKRPEWANQVTGGLVKFRPAVGRTEERQVLILGASIADNRMVSKELSALLKLEIAHETFDSQNEFCRDGTVSWYQIMRFLGLADSGGGGNGQSDHASLSLKRLDAFKALCVDRNSSITQTFHPKLYAPSDCESYKRWSKCWSRECLQTIKTIWECESTETTSGTKNDNDRRCSPPFRRILHLTRHPLVTIENFNNTICSSEKFQTEFFTIVAGFFPHRDWNEMRCLEAISWYTYDFEYTLLKARKESHLVDEMFAIETTSPCEVASMAGFMDDRSNAVDNPTLERLLNICLGPDDDDEKTSMFTNSKKKDAKANSQDIFVPKHSKNIATKIKTSLTWEDLEQGLGGNGMLVQFLRTLTEELGYSGQQRQGSSEFS